ncbi:M48 family metalloprotease [Candidatus Magnetaquicoccus inordinatus]|uniref:M48 family metalloprotease n=1 Tax=Candidatus Magnetaquicoccus inordinatus TaxID=2496818 RepID=UPI00102C2C94|nr:M48 family metalloprotease [Candidatus Magnetaquicoccus inordinatus]
MNLSAGMIQGLGCLVAWISLLVPVWAEAAATPNLLFSLLEKKYGVVERSANPQVERAQQIFARVQDVADRRANRIPQLTVVNQVEQPWAFTLPDGHILLSLGAVQLCYRHVGQNEGDARLAFVLGHELAHLGNNDFWDQEVYHALTKEGAETESNPQKQSKNEKLLDVSPSHGKTEKGVENATLAHGKAEKAVEVSTVAQGKAEKAVDVSTVAQGKAEKAVEVSTIAQGKAEKAVEVSTVAQGKAEKAVDTATVAASLAKEREADELGFLYAGMAGYGVHLLLDQSDDQQHDNFFTLWGESQHAGKKVAGHHPLAREREALLRARLDRLAEGITFFRFAVRLAHFGRCGQAIPLLRHFLQIFPSREVYNNLGACHLQRAQKGMNSMAAAASYWLPIVLDGYSRAEALIAGYPRQIRESESGLSAVMTDSVGEDLQQATEYLQQSAAMDEEYLPSRLNLATAYFYRQQILQARLALQEALRIKPGQADLSGWQGLMAYLDSEEQGLGEAALPHWQRQARKKEAPTSLLFNQAIVLRKLGRDARSWWKRVAARKEPLPPRYARIACAVARLHCLVESKEKEPIWPLPVQPGEDLDAADRQKLFAGWHATHLGWLPDKQKGIAYRRGGDVEVLDVDGYAAMVVLRDGRLGSASSLRNKLGAPLQIRPLAGDREVWNYGRRWAVLVHNGMVMEVWIVHRAE